MFPGSGIEFKPQLQYYTLFPTDLHRPQGGGGRERPGSFPRWCLIAGHRHWPIEGEGWEPMKAIPGNSCTFPACRRAVWKWAEGGVAKLEQPLPVRKVRPARGVPQPPPVVYLPKSGVRGQAFIFSLKVIWFSDILNFLPTVTSLISTLIEFIAGK